MFGAPASPLEGCLNSLLLSGTHLWRDERSPVVVAKGTRQEPWSRDVRRVLAHEAGALTCSIESVSRGRRDCLQHP